MHEKFLAPAQSFASARLGKSNPKTREGAPDGKPPGEGGGFFSPPKVRAGSEHTIHPNFPEPFRYVTYQTSCKSLLTSSQTSRYAGGALRSITTTENMT